MDISMPQLSPAFDEIQKQVSQTPPVLVRAKRAQKELELPNDRRQQPTRGANK
jgi:hypothetical protein